jgi:hypothetical protein
MFADLSQGFPVVGVGRHLEFAAGHRAEHDLIQMLAEHVILPLPIRHDNEAEMALVSTGLKRAPWVMK